MRTRAADRSFLALLQRYLSELRARRYSGGRVYAIRAVIEDLFAHLRKQRVRDVRAVKESDLVSFARHLAKRKGKHDRPLAPGSLSLYLGVVRGFFGFLVQRGHLLADPSLELRVRESKRLPVVLTEAEALRLMNAPDRGSAYGRRDRAILEVLYGTGIRAGECWRLDVTDVDLAQGRLFIRDGKGKKDRVVPIGAQAAAALDLYLREARPELVHDARELAVFLSQYGRRLSRAPLFQLVARYGRLARIRKTVFPHCLRHTCATHLLQGGADMRHVQELLGHKKLETTAIYTHVVTADLKTVFKRSHPRERRRR